MRRYDFTDGDLSVSLKQMREYLDADASSVPFKVLQFLFTEINYGGRVTDAKDRRLIGNLVLGFVNENVLTAGHAFSPSGVYASTCVAFPLKPWRAPVVLCHSCEHIRVELCPLMSRVPIRHTTADGIIRTLPCAGSARRCGSSSKSWRPTRFHRSPRAGRFFLMPFAGFGAFSPSIPQSRARRNRSPRMASARLAPPGRVRP